MKKAQEDADRKQHEQAESEGSADLLVPDSHDRELPQATDDDKQEKASGRSQIVRGRGQDKLMDAHKGCDCE